MQSVYTNVNRIVVYISVGTTNLSFSIPYSGKCSCGAKFHVFGGQVGMRENNNHENLNGAVNMTSLLEIACAGAGLRPGLRSRRLCIAIVDLQTPFWTPKDHFQKHPHPPQ